MTAQPEGDGRTPTHAIVHRQAVAQADRGRDGRLEAGFLLRVARALAIGQGAESSFDDVQLRAFATCDGDEVSCRLHLLAANGSGRTWRIAFQSAVDAELLAEVTAHEPRADSGASVAAATTPVVVTERDAPAIPATATADARWQQIFEAACEVIGRRGYGAASMREIAKTAGLPIATMYQHIGAKEDLLFMITKGCMEQLFAAFERDLPRDGTAAENLHDAISAYVDYIGRNRRYINLVYRETHALSADNREKIFAIERAFAARWQSILDAGVANGELRCADTGLAAHVLYFTCTIWALRYWALESFTADDLKTCIGTMVLDGLRA